jgi:hypothetical protein
LSDAQEVAVKKILEQQQQQILQIRRSPNVSGTTRIEQLRAVHTATVERLRAVLNDEQKAKYDPLAARQVPPAGQQRTVEDWLKAIQQK